MNSMGRFRLLARAIQPCLILPGIFVLFVPNVMSQIMMTVPSGSMQGCPAECSNCDLLWPVPDKSKLGYINQKGEIVIAPKFSLATVFAEGFASVCIGDRYDPKRQCQFIDLEGRPAFDQQDALRSGRGLFSEGLGAIDVDGKWGFIDRQGNIAIQPQYASKKTVPGYFREGLASIGIGDRTGYIDKGGSVVIKPQFEEASDFSEGLAAVKVGGKWGYIDKSGQFVIPAQYKSASVFCDGLAVVKVGNKVGYIDKSGKSTISPQFKNALMFSREHLAPVEVDGKWGYIDRSGKMMIPPQFKSALRFSDGLAGVQIDNKMGFIDTTGRVVIKPQYDWVMSFSNGIAFVSFGHYGGVLNVKGAKVGYINKEGQYIFQPVGVSGSGWGWGQELWIFGR